MQKVIHIYARLSTKITLLLLMTPFEFPLIKLKYKCKIFQKRPKGFTLNVFRFIMKSPIGHGKG